MFNETRGLGANESIVQTVPGASEYGGSNAGPSGMPATGPLLYRCTPDYIAKFKAVYGVAPAFCGKPIPGVARGTVYPGEEKDVPQYILPPTTRGPGAGQTYKPPPIAAPTTIREACTYAPPPVGMHYERGPTYDLQTGCGMVLTPDTAVTQPRPRAIPPATIRPAPRLPAPSGGATCPGAPSVCPPQGYVTCDIPGAHEYGVFPCRRGQPFVLDQARMAALTADAKRRGLSDFDEVLGFVSQPMMGLPMWAWAAVAIGIFMIVRRGRR